MFAIEPRLYLLVRLVMRDHEGRNDGHGSNQRCRPDAPVLGKTLSTHSMHAYFLFGPLVAVPTALYFYMRNPIPSTIDSFWGES